MVTEWISDVLMCLNYFMDQYGFSNKLSFCEIVPGKGKMDYDIKNITPGDYHQVYVRTTNTPKSRRLGSIILRP